MAWVTLCEDVSLDEAGEALVKSLMREDEIKYEDSIETKEEDEKDNLEVNDGNRLRIS
jgi:hypothetical protein